MRNGLGFHWILAPLAILISRCVVAANLPIDAFFDGMRIQQIALSPDGHYMATLGQLNGRYTVSVGDTSGQSKPKIVVASESDKRTDPQWCRWANNTRLLCAIALVDDEKDEMLGYTRLLAVNADGSDLKMLSQDESEAGGAHAKRNHSQFQTRIIDWTYDDPTTVMLELNTERNGFPAVYNVNVYTGHRELVLNSYPPIRRFITDGHGHVRLGSGFLETNEMIFAKLQADSDWRMLSKAKVFSEQQLDVFRPIGFVPGTNFIYASKSDGDREALWKIDLDDKKEPEIVFEHPNVDMGEARLAADGHLIGVAYETDRPNIYYADEAVHSLINGVNKMLPDTFNEVVGSSLDGSVDIIKSESDVSVPAYYLLRKMQDKFTLAMIGSRFPGLTNQTFGRMRSINYPAKDGTNIPGYLTTPPGVRAENLPLIVMPHSGPMRRDNWGFDWLQQFLVSRGYAVLQMNFRGSSGYGANWLWSARQDWGGLTYSDITDATQWAIKQGIADPKRICMVGWGFGGYAALLGATRDSKLYRCTVSIAGVSDLQAMLINANRFTNYKITKQQIGTDSQKLQEDSPQRHADDVSIPVLMIHGDHDATVPVEQTHLMEAALKHLGKSYKAVIIKGADHQLAHDSDRRTLLTELDAFLSVNMKANTQ